MNIGKPERIWIVRPQPAIPPKPIERPVPAEEPKVPVKV